MAMKINKDKAIKATANQKSSTTLIGVVVVAVVLFIAVFAVNMISTKQYKEVVEILVFKNAVTQGSLITAENFEKKDMLYSEYWNSAKVTMSDGQERRAIILYDEAKIIEGTYAGYYMKEGTPLYWSAFQKTATKKNSYLYQMDGELIKLDVSADVFGEMIVPGDKVNIRCKYTETSYDLPTVAEYEAMQQLGIATQSSETKQVMLFSEVSILDMLNSNGESIFDYYYDFVNLPIREQQALLEDSEFKSATTPSNIMLSVTAEEADNYFALQDKSPQYMLTLLPREGSNLILDALSSLDNSN